MLKVLASKWMHNFLPRVSCDLTLRGSTLITEYARCVYLIILLCIRTYNYDSYHKCKEK